VEFIVNYSNLCKIFCQNGTKNEPIQNACLTNIRELDLQSIISTR